MIAHWILSDVPRQLLIGAAAYAAIRRMLLGEFWNPEHRDALQPWKNRDEHTVEAQAMRAVPVLAATGW